MDAFDLRVPKSFFDDIVAPGYGFYGLNLLREPNFDGTVASSTSASSSAASTPPSSSSTRGEDDLDAIPTTNSDLTFDSTAPSSTRAPQAPVSSGSSSSSTTFDDELDAILARNPDLTFDNTAGSSTRAPQACYSVADDHANVTDSDDDADDDGDSSDEDDDGTAMSLSGEVYWPRIRVQILRALRSVTPVPELPCSICLEPMTTVKEVAVAGKVREAMLIFPCKHVVGSDCWNAWRSRFPDRDQCLICGRGD